MSKKQKRFTRDRYKILNVELDEKHVNPNTGDIEINLELDFINNSSKVINAFNSKVVDNKSLIFAYKGENKFRTTSEIPTFSDDHSYDFTLKLEKYKHIVAIDTNTFSVKLKLIDTEVKLGLGIGFILLEKEGSWKIEPINVPFVSSMNCEKPENENWVRLIELIKKNCKCEDERKIAVVVDSDLGNLDGYNKKLKPIFKDYFLPDEFELIFASDKVTDNIFNQMIKQCHSLSKELIPKFIRHLANAEQKLNKEK